MGPRFLKKGSQQPPPTFSAHVLCQTGRWIKMSLATEVGLGPGHIVLDGDAAPPKGAQQHCPLFGPCLLWQNGYRWIKMPLTTEVGLDPCHIMLDGDPAPKRGTAPSFGACLLRPNGLLDQDATWYGGRPRPRRHCTQLGPNAIRPLFSIGTLKLNTSRIKYSL